MRLIIVNKPFPPDR